MIRINIKVSAQALRREIQSLFRTVASVLCLFAVAEINMFKRLWYVEKLARDPCSTYPLSFHLVVSSLLCCFSFRTESVAEKLLTNWLSYTLHEFLQVFIFSSFVLFS